MVASTPPAPSAGAVSASFGATVSAITSAFGDPTRRSIYVFVRDRSPEGVTAAQVAEHVSVHPNVARHHLDKLAAGGYLEVAAIRAAGSGAGRPSKRYCAPGEDVPLDLAVRSDDLVLTLLGRAISLLPREQAEAMAEEVGRQYGAAMAAGFTGDDVRTEGRVAAGQRSLRGALRAVADALTAHGFAAHAEQRNDQLRIINNHCPFGELPIEHPVICAVDRGMVKGMLTALYGDTEPSLEASLPRGDGFCATAV